MRGVNHLGVKPPTISPRIPGPVSVIRYQSSPHAHVCPCFSPRRTVRRCLAVSRGTGWAARTDSGNAGPRGSCCRVSRVQCRGGAITGDGPYARVSTGSRRSGSPMGRPYYPPLVRGTVGDVSRRTSGGANTSLGSHPPVRRREFRHAGVRSRVVSIPEMAPGTRISSRPRPDVSGPSSAIADVVGVNVAGPPVSLHGGDRYVNSCRRFIGREPVRTGSHAARPCS